MKNEWWDRNTFFTKIHTSLYFSKGWKLCWPVEERQRQWDGETQWRGLISTHVVIPYSGSYSLRPWWSALNREAAVPPPGPRRPLAACDCRDFRDWLTPRLCRCLWIYNFITSIHSSGCRHTWSALTHACFPVINLFTQEKLLFDGSV